MLINNSDRQQTKPRKSRKPKKLEEKKWLQWLKKPSTFRFLLQIGLFIYKIVEILSELLGRD